MEQVDLLVSWMRDAVNGVSQVAFDPKSLGVLFTILVLVLLWSIVRALNRLARQLSSAVTELSELRSILKKLERRAAPREAKPAANDQGEMDILNLPLREMDDKR